MAENGEAWAEEQAVDGSGQVDPASVEEGGEEAEDGGRDPHLEQQQPPQQALHPQSVSHMAVLQALQGGHNLSPADMAALQQQHTALMLQAQQAQQDYGGDQRDKGGAMQMAPPEALAMHQLAAQQQGLESAGQLQHHEGDYDRERKEKRKVANREAARRMRQRRADQVNSLSVANTEMKAENAALQQQLAHLANHNRDLMTENAGLRQEVLNLKQTLENMRSATNALGNNQSEAGKEAS